ncbi:MAG: starch synthase [Planctomycetota bacterium]|jgi:starch synthase
MRICLVASELTPFAKTGGLADVSTALARHLSRAGHDVLTFLPLYPRCRRPEWPLQPVEGLVGLEVTFESAHHNFAVYSTPLPAGSAGGEAGPLIYFVDCPDLFRHDDLYTDDGEEHLRFALLSRAAIQSCQHLGWAPDVFHCNDWHTGLLPIYLNTLYEWDRLFANTKTLLTIHNIGYQGVFPIDVIESLGLAESRSLLWQEDVEQGHINYLKTGIQYASHLSTVSETYASEIQTEEFGNGLESLLTERADSLSGIVNGIDFHEWDPAGDEHIASNYSVQDPSGKVDCKQALMEEVGLSYSDEAPVLGIISRLTGQKGFELLPDALPIVLQNENVRMVILGSGEESYEQYFHWLARTFPDKVHFHCGYDEALSHRIEAGSDIFLMPSRYEPCGLNQMYSLRYGSVPLVRLTGGLADTVEGFDPDRSTGTGFVFTEFTSQAFLDTLRFALDSYRDREAWSALVRRGMSKDYSWEHQIGEYVRLYESLLG